MKKLKNNFKGLINSFSSTIDIRRNIIQFIQNHYSDDDDICNILGIIIRKYNRIEEINEIFEWYKKYIPNKEENKENFINFFNTFNNNKFDFFYYKNLIDFFENINDEKIEVIKYISNKKLNENNILYKKYNCYYSQPQ